MARILGPAIFTGTVASLASTAALALLARSQGKAAVQPTNSTSHWLHGDKAALVRRIDAAHTGVGYATHHASAIFWALTFHWWLSRRPPGSPARLLRDASVMTAIATTVDYVMTPKRLTPGWEEVLPKKSIALAYVAFAVGLTIGALASQPPRKDQNR